MIRDAASGWDTNEMCDAGASSIVALARSAMKRCSSGGIALLSVPSKYQHGSVVHAGGEDGVAANAAPRRGAVRPSPGGARGTDVGGEGLVERRLLSEVEVGALAPVGDGERNGSDRRAD